MGQGAALQFEILVVDVVNDLLRGEHAEVAKALVAAVQSTTGIFQTGCIHLNVVYSFSGIQENLYAMSVLL